MIHQLKADGLNHSQIARQLNLDRKTVHGNQSSEPGDTVGVPRRARPSKLDRYRDHLHRRVNEHPQLCTTRFWRDQGAGLYQRHFNSARLFAPNPSCRAGVRDSIRDSGWRTGTGEYFLLQDPLPRSTRAGAYGVVVFLGAWTQPLVAMGKVL